MGECDLPLSFDYGLPCYYLIAPAEASSNLARYDGVRYGRRSEEETYRAMVERTRDEGFEDEPKRRIMLGTYALSAGYYDAYYGQAQKVRTLIVREHAAAFEQFDVLVTPTSPTVAFPVGDKAADPLAMYACDLLTIPSCLAGLPGLNVPCGFSEGLPVGLQLIGTQFGENTLFRAGHADRAGAGLDLVPAAAMTWEPVIGLEIHVQLKTRTKMPLPRGVRRGGEHADVRMPGLPGALLPNPAIGDRGGRLGLRSIARSRRAPCSRGRTTTPTCRRAIRFPNTIFPLASMARMVPLRTPNMKSGSSAHLEEDAAKNVRGRAHGRDRAPGVHARRLPRRDPARGDRDAAGHPLAEEAKKFLQLLRQTIVGLGSPAVVEKDPPSGRQRLRAAGGSDELRTRCEIKNMNSFTHIARGSMRRSAGRSRSGSRAPGGAAHVRLRRRYRDAHRAPDEGRGGRLPLLPGARPRSRRAAGETWSVSPLGAAGAACAADPTDRGRAGPRPGARAGHGWPRPWWEATVAAGADGVAASNVIANRLVGAGVDPAVVDASEAARLVDAKRIPRKAFDEAIARSSPCGRAVSRAGGRVGHRVARADRRRDPGGEPGPGRGVPRRQGRLAGVLRGSGDEGDEGAADACRPSSVPNSPAMDGVSADTGISLDELRLAAETARCRWRRSLADHARRAALPLDPLRRAARRRGGLPTRDRRSRSRVLALTLDDLRDRPAVEAAVTMECAGNGRALLDPRPVSQPWLTEAVGTARWRGVPLSTLLEEASPAKGAVDVVFAGLDQGVGEVEQLYEKAAAGRGARGGLPSRLRDERQSALPQRLPLRLVVPGGTG